MISNFNLIAEIAILLIMAAIVVTFYVVSHSRAKEKQNIEDFREKIKKVYKL